MRRRWLRRLGWTLLGLIVLLALPAVYIHGLCRGGGDAPAAEAAPPATVAAALASAGDYKRDEARSFLTFPEWYIVFTARDYAAYIAAHRPSGFRYFASAFAFWGSYCDVNRHVAPRYAFNTDFHIVNYVIGVSHSVELVLKGLYENTVGRLSELFAPDAPTAEERFAQALFADYAAFLDLTPWYDYPFAKKRTELAALDAAGSGWLRRWERRAALTAELWVKDVYAGMIRGGTEAAFAPEAATTVAAARVLRPERLAAIPEIRPLAEAGDARVLSFPRYAPFTGLLLRLTAADLAFVSIAGNDEILITALLKNPAAPPPEGAREVFRADTLSGGGGSRVGLAVPVDRLMAALDGLRARGDTVEHIYDY
jgi:hypothetical protein